MGNKQKYVLTLILLPDVHLDVTAYNTTNNISIALLHI